MCYYFESQFIVRKIGFERFLEYSNNELYNDELVKKL